MKNITLGFIVLLLLTGSGYDSSKKKELGNADAADSTVAVATPAEVVKPARTPRSVKTEMKAVPSSKDAGRVSNGDMEVWTNPATLTNWTLSGTGGTLSREGTIKKSGRYSAKMTRNGGDVDGCFLYQYLDVRGRPPLSYWQGRTVTFSCWVYATVAHRARLRITDGATCPFSSYHTGDSTWQLLTLTHTIPVDATQFHVDLYVDRGDTSAYFDFADLSSLRENQPRPVSPEKEAVKVAKKSS